MSIRFLLALAVFACSAMESIAQPGRVIERAREALIALSAVLGVLLIFPLSAQAAFPGINGKIAMALGGEGTSGIYVTDVGYVSSGSHDLPAWSPDGTRLAYRSYFPQAIIVVNADGTDPRTVAYLTTNSDVAWDPFGKDIWFYQSASGIWRVKADGSSTPILVLQDATAFTASQMNWSARSDDYPRGRLAYLCNFRSGHNDLCIYEPPAGSSEIGGGTTRQLPIDHGDYSNVLNPNWSPDGRKIVFTLGRAVTANTGVFNDPTITLGEWDIFSVNADGSGLTQLTPSQLPDAEGCPNNLEASLSQLFNPAYSPDGSLIVVEGSGTKVQNNGAYCWLVGTAGGVYTVSANGGTPSFLFSAGSALDWQPLPADLTVIIDDGHGRPLNGLKVQVRNPETGAIVLENPVHTGFGKYVFKDVPAGPWVVRTTLTDFKNEPGYKHAFEIRHDPEFSEAAWAEHSVTVPPTGGTIARLPFEEQTFVPTDAPPLIASSVDQSYWDRLDDMAAIYYEFQRYVAWVKRTLTADTGATVVVYAFALTDPGTSDPIYSPDGAFYQGGDPAIIAFGTNFSRYEYRDGSYSDDDYGDEAPENGEWHEFNHHLWFTFVDKAAACVGVNHKGYLNPDTCDSMFEGFANFLAAAAAREIEGATDSFYDGSWNLEAPLKAWSSYKSSSGEQVYEEDVAVSALLWDLHDDAPDSFATAVIAEDGSHVEATYNDQHSESIVDIWARFTSAKPLTVDALRESYGTPDLSIDLDDDGFYDIAPIDQVFLMHGFFPIDHDETITSSHKTYHYDVNYVQRTAPTAARNAVIGWSSHRVLAANGIVLNTFIPRSHMPTDPNAKVAIDIRDASGTPLSGAEIDLVIDYPGQQQSISTRRLGEGAGNLVPLRLPSYYDYLLPEDAPLPECDPVSDELVTVTVRARVNGYLSTDSPSFDNCTYQRAVATAANPGALSFTLTFPVDSAPPESAIETVPSETLIGSATTGFWTVLLSCADPADSGFAAGCARIDYRLDNGPITEYERSVRVAGVGPHNFEYRSVDAAGNEESWRSVALDIVATPPPTISGFSPSVGAVGEFVSISGTNFDDPLNSRLRVTDVTFGSVAAEFTIVSPSVIYTTVPAGATSGPIRVTGPGGTASSSTDFTVALPPSISSFSPPSGPVGTVITVTGSNLAGVTFAWVNQTPAGFGPGSSAAQMLVLVREGSTSGPITVETPGGIATSPTDFVVTTVPGGPQPSITSFSPTNGKVGSSVTIKGSNLSGASSVTFNGVSASFRYKGSSIIATVPAGATTGPIRVTTAGGVATTTTTFVVNQPPTVAGISPASGTIGSTVTVTGTNFTGATAVKFGGSSAKFTVVSATTITATVPKGAKSGPVSVTTPGGTGASGGSFTVVK